MAFAQLRYSGAAEVLAVVRSSRKKCPKSKPLKIVNTALQLELARFNIHLGNRCLQTYADPPEDPLNELSAFELGIRRFCYDYNRPVDLEIGEERLQVFLDPDICMLLEDELPQKIVNLEKGQNLILDFCESESVTLSMVVEDATIDCCLRYFGDSVKERRFTLDRDRVVMTLKLFLYQVIANARDSSYITSEETLDFLKPTLVSA